MTDRRAIAVFDSGLGGISVLRELVRQMPQENYLYFGDSKHAPYGTKSTQQVRTLTLQAVQPLMEHGIKALVVACNTATSAAIDLLRSRYPSCIIIGIEPALKLAVDRHPGKRIVVMATNMTLREEKFARLIEHCQASQQIDSLPCPGLVEFVESGILNGPELEAFLSQRLTPHLNPKPAAIVLGCTHYPFVRPSIAKIAGPDVEILDGSEGTARETQRRLRQAGLLLPPGAHGSVTFRNSLPSPELLDRCAALLQLPYETA